MKVPLFLLIASLAGMAAALAVPGGSDLALLAGVTAVAALCLMLQARVARPSRPADPRPRPHIGPRLPTRRTAPDGPPKWIVIDGSNVLYWRDNTPQIDTVREVVSTVKRRGLTPMVVFDANAGYLTAGKYQHDFAFSRALGLPDVQVMVVEKGTPADPAVLDLARGLQARVISNDRYRDWADTYREVREPKLRVTGGFEDGRLSLAL